MEQMTTVSVISLFPENKKEIAEFTAKYIDEICNGINDPLKEFIKLKKIDATLKEIAKSEKIKEAVLTQANKHGKTFDYNQAKVEVCELCTKYDYSSCGDKEYLSLMTEIMELDAKIKIREKFLKAVPYEGITQVDKETGECYEIYPPAKTSETGVKITINK